MNGRCVAAVWPYGGKEDMSSRTARSRRMSSCKAKSSERDEREILKSGVVEGCMSTPSLYPSLTEADRIEIRLGALNDCAPEMARVQFSRCCGSTRWVHGMEQARPFSDVRELETSADRMWASCSREDWLEAFSAHPRIGEASENRWSRQEQSRVEAAPSVLLETLALANRAYEAKFGYTFIVCATGKSAAEILAMVERRMHNDADKELENAAEQQRLILQLRLRKLLSA